MHCLSIISDNLGPVVAVMIENAFESHHDLKNF